MTEKSSKIERLAIQHSNKHHSGFCTDKCHNSKYGLKQVRKNKWYITCIPDTSITIKCPGKYYFRNNIVWNPTNGGNNCKKCLNGINVMSDNVIIDLDGYTYSQKLGSDGLPIAPFTNGIKIYEGFKNITIRNGTISDFAAFGVVAFKDGTDNRKTLSNLKFSALTFLRNGRTSVSAVPFGFGDTAGALGVGGGTVGEEFETILASNVVIEKCKFNFNGPDYTPPRTPFQFMDAAIVILVENLLVVDSDFSENNSIDFVCTGFFSSDCVNITLRNLTGNNNKGVLECIGIHPAFATGLTLENIEGNGNIISGQSDRSTGFSDSAQAAGISYEVSRFVSLKNCHAHNNNASFTSLRNPDPSGIPFLKVRGNGFQSFRSENVVVDNCEASGNVVTVNGADPLAPSSANGFIFNGSQLTLKNSSFTGNQSLATANTLGGFGTNLSLYNTDNGTFGEIRNATAPLLNNNVINCVNSNNGASASGSTTSAGIYLQSSQNGEIKNNIVEGNSGNGILIEDGVITTDEGPVIFISNNLLVLSNTINTNTEAGISDQSTGLNIYLDNTALKNNPNYVGLGSSPIVTWTPPAPFPSVPPKSNLSII